LRRILLTVGTFIILVTVALVFHSHSKKTLRPLAAVQVGMASSMRFQYAVYLLSKPKDDPSVLLQAVLAHKFPALKIVDQLSSEPRQMQVVAGVHDDVQERYAPPSIKALKYSGYGLSADQAQSLQKSTSAFVMTFAHPKEYVWTALHNADAIVEEVARQTGGTVWDEETREAFSPDAWHKRRLESWTDPIPEVSTQMVIQSYQKDHFSRAITLGMAKMGLPDLIVNGFPWSYDDQVGDLMNVFAQLMAEGASMDRAATFQLDLRSLAIPEMRAGELKGLKENVLGIAYVSLRVGKWEEGDPKNRLIELTAEKYQGDDVPAKQELLISCLFGTEDSVAYVDHNDELLEESRKEKAKLPQLHKAFSAGLQPGEYIEVKAPFLTIEGGQEWMWVEVTDWHNGKIRGTLDNDPASVPGLRAGQIVAVKEEDVFDYIRHYPDRTTEGNTTAPFLEKVTTSTHPTGFDAEKNEAACTPN
jgi:uncharacterized protein YegJ (DUF2314 family)